MTQDFKNSHRGTLNNIKHWGVLCLLIFISCAQKSKDLYKSTCDKGKTYQKINLNDLLKNINNFQGKYVEIEGLYKGGFEESALHASNNEEGVLWVNFDYYVSKCPLVSPKGNIDLFGKEQVYKKIYDKNLILHGKINTTDKGHLSQYKATIEEITLVSIE